MSDGNCCIEDNPEETEAERELPNTQHFCISSQIPHLNDRHVGRIEDFNARRKAAVKRQTPGEETRALKTKSRDRENKEHNNYMQD